MPQFDRSELVLLAKICYENYRHEDVMSYIKEVIKMGTPLNPEEKANFNLQLQWASTTLC